MDALRFPEADKVIKDVGRDRETVGEAAMLSIDEESVESVKVDRCIARVREYRGNVRRSCTGGVSRAAETGSSIDDRLCDDDPWTQGSPVGSPYDVELAALRIDLQEVDWPVVVGFGNDRIERLDADTVRREALAVGAVPLGNGGVDCRKTQVIRDVDRRYVSASIRIPRCTFEVGIARPAASELGEEPGSGSTLMPRQPCS